MNGLASEFFQPPVSNHCFEGGGWGSNCLSKTCCFCPIVPPQRTYLWNPRNRNQHPRAAKPNTIFQSSMLLGATLIVSPSNAYCSNSGTHRPPLCTIQTLAATSPNTHKAKGFPREQIGTPIHQPRNRIWGTGKVDSSRLPF